MKISPDQFVLWSIGPFDLNATLVFTWVVMALLVLGSWLVTRRLSTEPRATRLQSVVEVVVIKVREQIRDVSRQEPDPYMPFVATLFLFIATANFLVIVPGYMAPTGSLSTTTALAVAVFFAVPAYAITREGALEYVKHYVRPSPLMLPFNLIAELSRTVALAVRLFGNIMSGRVIVAIVLSLVPFVFPVVMQVLGLITGMIQAYIFAVLATIYIASATSAHARTGRRDAASDENDARTREE